jgi:hypothetical protein
MAEWLYEDGIGERRAALIAEGAITAIAIERDGDGVRAGSICKARLIGHEGALAIVRLESGEEAVCSGIARSVSQGAPLIVEIVRSAIAEADLTKRAKARAAGPDVQLCDGPTLRARITADGAPVRDVRAHDADLLEAAGWSEALEEAASGLMPFDGGILRMSLTPAMTVFDVDGTLPAPALALAGARAAAAAIHRLDIGGAIVIDLPTLANKGERVAVAEALDAALPGAFERTAINGYGLIQIIRRRVRASIAERMQFARSESAALAALRLAERARGTGTLILSVHPAVAGWLEDQAPLIKALARRTGRSVVLQADTGRAMGACHVH